MAKIKICGLFREEDIVYVNEAMPDYIGFVFAKSKRQVSFSKALRLHSNLNSEIISVGVFVNESIENIASLYNEGIIKIAQLHGNESIDYIKKLKGNCDIPIIKAIKIDSQADISEFEIAQVDYFLFDSQTGGSGKSFDWALIPKTKTPFFLAGGLNINNIENAIKSINPYAVDISSGVEENGIKNRKKVMEIERSVRNV